MSDHTKGHWKVVEEDGFISVVAENGFIVIPEMRVDQCKFDFRRIVACVNACDVIPDESLKSWLNPPEGQLGAPHGTWAQQLATVGRQQVELQRQHDELLDIVKEVVRVGRLSPAGHQIALDLVQKIEGGAR